MKYVVRELETERARPDFVICSLSGAAGVDSCSPCGPISVTFGGALAPTAANSCRDRPRGTVTAPAAAAAAAAPGGLTVYRPLKLQPWKSVLPPGHGAQKCVNPITPLKTSR